MSYEKVIVDEVVIPLGLIGEGLFAQDELTELVTPETVTYFFPFLAGNMMSECKYVARASAMMLQYMLDGAEEYQVLSGYEQMLFDARLADQIQLEAENRELANQRYLEAVEAGEDLEGLEPWPEVDVYDDLEEAVFLVANDPGNCEFFLRSLYIGLELHQHDTKVAEQLASTLLTFVKFIEIGDEHQSYIKDMIDHLQLDPVVIDLLKMAVNEIFDDFVEAYDEAIECPVE